ncbi:MAG: class I SAM-dependent RNA methyltransferase [Candidatus Delongbacteria bacterium]|jgi:putative N6-adenine-specific DNA methylase|nr:class I SAM-dependent RNA methyltransferase [Candidatus Delongbacteria bacterium]
MKYNIIATCTFGLESVLKKELLGLGYNDLNVQDGRITFQSDESGIARTNIFLRTADRVYLKLSEFPANDFDELFEGVYKINWQDMIPVNGIMHVNGRSKKSKLSSVPACQSITKKAIIEKMKLSYKVEKFTEDGTKFPIEIILENNKAIVTLDTSGTALYKRGYRLNTGDAPLKETLAAGLILLSNWRPNTPLIDPFCGSGTVLIEAAMIGKNIAPGLNRHFLAMNWDFIDKGIWKQAVDEAFSRMNKNKLDLYGYDIDSKVIKYARLNSENAELNTMINYDQKDIADFNFSNEKGSIITNLPYGERLGDKDSLDGLYKTFKDSISQNDQFGKSIFTAHDHFQEIFGRANKKRKLYNGNIKCILYSYYSKR